MDKSQVDIYLEKLEEFVCDEEKIVTVRWLCINLKITPKDAKNLLNKYIIQSNKSQPGNLSILYVLSGRRENTLTISLAKEDELEDKKDLYTSEPVVEVYSVQKAKDTNFNTVALVDCFNVNKTLEYPILGTTTTKNCVKRNLKQKVLPPPPAPTLKEKTSFFTKLPPKSTNNHTNNDKPTSKLMNGNVSAIPKQSAFDRFFTNVDQKATIKKESDLKAPIDTGTEEKTILVDSDSDSESVSQKETTQDIAKEKKAKRTRKKNGSTAKRRKRIMEQESDDDIFANDDDDDDENEEEISRKRKNIITDSDEEQPVLKEEPLPELPKNKRRKLVDRTFQDEEGFTITKKEWVEEDVSEDEIVMKIKIEATSVEVKIEPQIENVNETNKDKQKKNISPKNEKIVNGKGKGKKAVPTNQTTLMNFFKRK